MALGSVPVLAGPFDARPDDLAPRSLATLSSPPSPDWGRTALSINPEKWEHGETAHFVIHYFKRGQKIATRCEKFYETIRGFFGNPPDRMGTRKSHVYAFHEPEDWAQFAATTGLGNIAGVTRNHEFYYLTTDHQGRFDGQGRVQAHEMTHLVFHRFFSSTPPLWLNEGIAEYFGQRENLSTTEFRRQMAAKGRFPLDELFAAAVYPEDVHGFYAEAAVLVDFLTHTSARERLLPRFVDAMIRGGGLETALALYGYDNLNDLKEDYERYRSTRF